MPSGALKSLADYTVHAVKGVLIFIEYREHPGSILNEVLSSRIKCDLLTLLALIMHSSSYRRGKLVEVHSRCTQMISHYRTFLYFLIFILWEKKNQWAKSP